MIAIRLDPSTERMIETTAKAHGISKSELVRRSIFSFLKREHTKSAWELGHDLFGRYGSGDATASTTRKRQIREKIRAKTHR